MKTTILFILFFQLTIICNAQIHLGPGQSYSNIQSAFEDGVIHPGDTVWLHSGSYRSNWQGISNLKGNNSKWIVITRYKNDEIDISGTWQFMSCEYIKFLNLNFKANSTNPGRLISVDNSGSCETQSKYIKFDSCTFSDVTDANAITSFKFGGVDNFEVTNCLFQNMTVCSAFDFNVCHNGLISSNRIENCLTGGHIKGGASDITMERNLFINASQESWVVFEFGGDTGSQFYCSKDNFEVKNLNFFSNIVIGGYRGLALSSAVDCKVINNTFYNCSQATMRFLTTSTMYPQLTCNRVENNIFSFGSSAYFNGSPQLSNSVTFKKNIYYSITNSIFNGPYWDIPELDPIKDQNPMNFGSNTIMFNNTLLYDFNLAEGSPAIGTGLSENEPITDFLGKQFSSITRSIGAIEYQSKTAILNDHNFYLNLYPNPATEYIEIYSENEFDIIQIYNLYGNKVLECNNKQRINISFLPPGIYMIKASNKIYKFCKI